MIDEDIRDIHFLYLESTMKVNLVQFWSLNNRCQNVRCQLLLSTFCSESINIQQNPENLAIDRDHLHKLLMFSFFRITTIIHSLEKENNKSLFETITGETFE